MNAFGNALGNSIVGAIKHANLPAEVKDLSPQGVAAYEQANARGWDTDEAIIAGRRAHEAHREANGYGGANGMRYDGATFEGGRFTLRPDGPEAFAGPYDNSGIRTFAYHDSGFDPVLGTLLVDNPLAHYGSMDSIGPDGGLVDNLGNMWGAWRAGKIGATDALSMAWDYTKYSYRGSDTAQGVVQIGGGGLEVLGAAGLSGIPGGAFVGGPLAFHGGDQIGTGINRIVHGETFDTATFTALEKATGSRAFAHAVDVGIPLLGGAAGLGATVGAVPRVLDQWETASVNRVMATDLANQDYVYRLVRSSDLKYYEAAGSVSGKGNTPTYFSLDTAPSIGEHMLGAQMKPGVYDTVLRIPTSELVRPSVPRPYGYESTPITFGREYATYAYPEFGTGGFRQIQATTRSYSPDWVMTPSPVVKPGAP